MASVSLFASEQPDGGDAIGIGDESELLDGLGLLFARLPHSGVRQSILISILYFWPSSLAASIAPTRLRHWKTERCPGDSGDEVSGGVGFSCWACRLATRPGSQRWREKFFHGLINYFGAGLRLLITGVGWGSNGNLRFAIYRFTTCWNFKMGSAWSNSYRGNKSGHVVSHQNKPGHRFVASTR